MNMGAEILAEVPRDRPDGYEFDVCKFLLISGVAIWRVGLRFRLAPADAVSQVCIEWDGDNAAGAADSDTGTFVAFGQESLMLEVGRLM
ncbi:hypothetical protein BPAE_0071g00030 [Botrytis paeoniae]|uniref:Uncharacterized protein n=1 Tax=Botrytis paeoniae TaxID=278948 RepID=A0A4Z1FSE5_9HELO|nr:hypothetical protein BPAE_0071g00030 [Botrytis paeoniae]